MKRWVLVLFMVISLSGCKGNKEILTDLSEFPDNSFSISAIEKVDCYLGSGSVYALSDASHIEDVYDCLLSIAVDTASSENDLYIEDGDILFSFIDEDDTKHSISFLTSEYYFDGEKYYKVREREKLRELMDRVRDYYQMEEDEFILEIVDNGCEARNVLVIKNKDEEAYIEGVYEIVSRSYEDECLVLTLKTGDYYSHESIRTYIVTLNNGKIEVRDGE